MYVISLTPLRVAIRFFYKVYSLLHPPLQSLPPFTCFLPSPLHITLPPYLSLARSLLLLFELPFPPFTPFLCIHTVIPSLLFFYFLCPLISLLLYLPFLPSVLSSSFVSALFVFSYFLPLPSLSIDFSSSQFHILSSTINLPYLTFALFPISLSFSATFLINHCILCCFHIKFSSIISHFPFRFLFFSKTSIFPSILSILTSNSYSRLICLFILISLASSIFACTYLSLHLFHPHL